MDMLGLRGIVPSLEVKNGSRQDGISSLNSLPGVAIFANSLNGSKPVLVWCGR